MILVPKYSRKNIHYIQTFQKEENEITVFLYQHLDDTKNIFKEKKRIWQINISYKYKCKNTFLNKIFANNSNILLKYQIRSDKSLSCVWLFATPWIKALQASLSITNSRSSLRLTYIESVMPSSHHILCRPLLLLPPIPPSISLFQWVNSSHEVAKALEFQL